MTYGSPRDPDDVGAYISRVRGGREPSAELLDEFRRRYAAIGGSPLVAITLRLAAALEACLNDGAASGAYRVAAGMRFSAPSIADAVTDTVWRGASNIIGLILSPQYSPLLMGGYGTALEDAAAAHSLPTVLVGAWHTDPAFLEVLASRVRGALADLAREGCGSTPVLLTAHSLPRRIVDREPDYVEQLKAAATAIAQRAGLSRERWRFVYQSAGHTPEEWLKPDLLDVLPELAAEGHESVLVAPVQFLADHLETLYDIDLAAAEQARQAGIERFMRVTAPNDATDLAQALAGLIRQHSSRDEQRSPVLAAPGA